MMASASALPGQMRQPAPNGARQRSLPSTVTSSSPNLSGLNASGFSETYGSSSMPNMLTMAVVPAGTR